jgi:P-type Ca2+ transporter type 2C
MKKWYQLSADAICQQLDVQQRSGLSSHEGAARLKTYGSNQLSKTKKINPATLFFNQFKDTLVIILIIAAMVSFSLAFIEEEGGMQESLLIMVIVLAIAVVGFFNEYKAEKTVEALSKLVGFKTRVRRDGKLLEIEAADVVPGDIVVFEAGQKISADIRLISANDVRINEASLTGESLPVTKNPAKLTGELPLGDQRCMLFAGTFVTNGSGEGVVVATGQRTEIGKIADLVEGVDTEPTPMQQKLDDLGKKLGYFIAAICVVVFVIVFFFVKEDADATLLRHIIFAFTAAVALAVAAIPEGLAFVVRISLALGARRMAHKKALVRKLSAVEALGSTDVICSDKTGTLTRGEMTVRALHVNGRSGVVDGSGYDSVSGSIRFEQNAPDAKLLLELGLLCNNASIRHKSVIGDPTEGALIISAAKMKLDSQALLAAKPRIHENPFDSERKRMSTVHKDGAEYLVACKGALESVLDCCSHYIDERGKVQTLTATEKQRLQVENKILARQALRVLAFAYKTSKKELKDEHACESGLTFVGLQAMMDPPRKEVMRVIHRVQSEAGMRVIMITGDYIDTAQAIAKEIGIIGDAISGPELDAMTQKEFEQKVQQISVYARVNPEHKIRIVQALKHHGHQVAMTGDGVNDAPAIKAADIGIAMGITGTDVAKEAADVILLDDQFLTIVNAIEEGRGIFDNVRKFVNFLISCNIAEVLTIVVGVIIFQDLVLTAAQLLFINIVTDGLPAVALGSDPAQKGILRSSPKRFQEAIISRRVWVEMTVFGVLMTTVIIIQYWFVLQDQGRAVAVTTAFTAMVVYQMVRLVDIRTNYKIKWFSNPWLSVAIASSLLLHLILLHVDVFAQYFGVGPLPLKEWMVIGFGAIFLFLVMKFMNSIFDMVIPTTDKKT